MDNSQATVLLVQLGLDTSQQVDLHTGSVCGSATIRNVDTGEIRLLLCKSKECPTCRAYMAQRLVRQIQEEGGARRLQMVEVARVDWPALRKRLLRAQAGYKSFPTASDRLVIMTDMAGIEGAALPDTQDALQALLDELIEQTPEGKRISGSRGFGQSWQGAHAENKRSHWQRYDLNREEVVGGLEEQAQQMSLQARLIDNAAHLFGMNGEAMLGPDSSEIMDRIVSRKQRGPEC